MDNGFLTDGLYSREGRRDKIPIIVPGTFIVRRADELGHKPMVGLLHSNGKITPHYLDTSKDKFVNSKVTAVYQENDLDAEDFLNELKDLGATGLDFKAAVLRTLDERRVKPPVRTMVLESLDKERIRRGG
jgi:hypothetical protein